jgi:hypothetical protein
MQVLVSLRAIGIAAAVLASMVQLIPRKSAELDRIVGGRVWFCSAGTMNAICQGNANPPCSQLGACGSGTFQACLIATAGATGLCNNVNNTGCGVCNAPQCTCQGGGGGP